MDSVVICSGVRQGCPLPPLLFALAADILLRRIADCLRGDEAIKAFADDTAVVVSNYVRAMPCMQQLFSEFERISSLGLNVHKTVMIPLWRYSSEGNLRRLVQEICPVWKDIRIAGTGKYFGFLVGPGSCGESWKKPLAKYLERAWVWSNLHLGMCLNAQAYRILILSILSFVMQLETCPQ